MSRIACTRLSCTVRVAHLIMCVLTLQLGYDLALMTPYQYYLHERGMLNDTVGPIGSTPWVCQWMH